MFPDNLPVHYEALPLWPVILLPVFCSLHLLPPSMLLVHSTIPMFPFLLPALRFSVPATCICVPRYCSLDFWFLFLLPALIFHFLFPGLMFPVSAICTFLPCSCYHQEYSLFLLPAWIISDPATCSSTPYPCYITYVSCSCSLLYVPCSTSLLYVPCSCSLLYVPCSTSLHLHYVPCYCSLHLSPIPWDLSTFMFPVSAPSTYMTPGFFSLYFGAPFPRPVRLMNPITCFWICVACSCLGPSVLKPDFDLLLGDLNTKLRDFLLMSTSLGLNN